jgi:hypothetical protein
VLERFDHLFRLMPVLAQQDVDMVRHDRAGVASIALDADDFVECLRNLLSRWIIKSEQRMLEESPGTLVELLDHSAGWLHGFAAVVKFAQLGEHVLADLR